MATILVIARLCEPWSELHIVQDWYRRTALADLLGAPEKRVNKNRLYRALRGDRGKGCASDLSEHLFLGAGSATWRRFVRCR